MSVQARLRVTVDGAVEAEAQLNRVTRGLTVTRSQLFALLRIARQAAVGVYIFSSALNRAREQTWSYEDAQRNLTRTMREYGSGSEEAREAARKLDRAEVRLNASRTQNIITLGTYIANLGFSLGMLAMAKAGTNSFTFALAAEGSVVSTLTGLYHSLTIAKLAAVALPIAAFAVAWKLAAPLREPRPPRAQFGGTVKQTGFAEVHRGETISRGGKGGMGGANITIQKVVLSPKGKTVQAWLKELGQLIGASRPEIW